MQPSFPRGDCGLNNTLELPEVGTTEHENRLDTAGIAYFFSCSSVVSMPILLEHLPQDAYGYWPRSVLRAQKDE